MQASEFAVRLAKPSELHALLRCDAYAQSHEHRRHELYLALESQSCLVAELEGEAVGFVVLQ